MTSVKEIKSLDVIKCLSMKDSRTHELMKDSVTMANGYYELLLPRHLNYQLLTDNKIMATNALTA